MLIDEFLPDYDVVERHETRVRASPRTVYAAIAQTLLVVQSQVRGQRQRFIGQSMKIIRRARRVAGKRRHRRNILPHTGTCFTNVTHAPLVEPHRSLAHIQYKGQIVSDDDQRHTFRDEFVKPPAAFLLKEDVPDAECFVDDQHVRLDRDGDRESHPHYHAGGIGFHRLFDE